MRAVIDTTSLVSFVRYYLPFDKADKLKKLLEKKFNSGEMIVLDKVYEKLGRALGEVSSVHGWDKISRRARHAVECLRDERSDLFLI